VNRPIRIRLAGVLAVAAIAVTACGGDDGGKADSTTTTEAAKAAFPVTVTADNGEVTIDAAPKRIVSLSASLTEMLYAIDAGDQVVAVDKYSNYPDGTPVTELSGFRPNVEAIGGYTPDLVLVSGDSEGIVTSLGALGIDTLVLPSADTVDDVYAQIETLGDATGHPAEADALVDDVRGDLADIVKKAGDHEGDTYFYEVSDDLYSVTSDTFIGGLLKLVGLKSIADGVDDAAGGYPQLTNEYVLDADPDFIFLADTQGVGLTVADAAARPGWSELSAVKANHLVALPDDIASRWGPRIVDLLSAVVDALTGAPATTTTAAG
jgi:iron complex transport system substrate-binding protein